MVLLHQLIKFSHKSKPTIKNCKLEKGRTNQVKGGRGENRMQYLTGLATTIRDWSDKAAERPSVERGPSNEEEEEDDDEAAAFASFEILPIHF